MKKQTIFLAFVFTGSLFMSACSTNAGTGAVVGSLVGAGIGKSTSNHRDKRAVIGGVIGGIVGSAIGAEQDRANAYNNSAQSSGYYSEPEQQPRQVIVNRQPEYVYVDPYYPISPTIIIGRTYYHRPRHDKRHHRVRYTRRY